MSSPVPAATAPAATVPVAAAATFLVLVSFTTPLTTLTSTSAALGSGPGGQAWILSSMSIGLGVALLSTGAVADDFGRRRALVVGCVVLAVASAVSALAPSTGVLVGARIVAGVGGAAMVAAGLGLIGRAAPAGSPAARTASGVWGASLGAGIAVGPLLAGAGERLVDWTAAYWLTGLLAAALAVTARLTLAESRAERPRPVDLPGVLLLAAGVGALLSGLVQARGGLLRVPVLALVAGGLVLLAAFMVVEARRRHPMLDPALFASPAFVAATTGAFATGLGIIATTSFLPTVLQRGQGSSASVAALVLLAWSATSVVTSLLARRLPAGLSGRALLAGGLVVVAAGQLLLLVPDPGSSPAGFVPGLLVAGLASGVINSALGREAVASVPPSRTAMGSGANNTARYVGSAVGVTVVAVLATRPGLPAGPAGLFAGWHTAVVVAAVLTLLGALAVATCRPRPGPGDGPGPDEGGARAGERADSGHGQGTARGDPGPPQAAVP